MSNDAVRLPTWVITLLVGVLLSAVGAIFFAGESTNMVQDLKSRIDRLEDRFDKFEETRGLKNGH